MPQQSPKCPKCGGRKTKPQGGYYFCAQCQMLFDDDPDEGGTYSDRDPSARLERAERNERGRSRRRED